MDKQTLSDIAAQFNLITYFGLNQTIITQETLKRNRIVVKIDETKANHYKIKNSDLIAPPLKQAIQNYARTPLTDRLTFEIELPKKTS